MAQIAEDLRLVIGQRVREIRKTKGWSQERLAREIEASRETVRRIEEGRTHVGSEMLNRLVAALDTHPSYLMGYSRHLDNPGEFNRSA
jgi:transcriptional regulator with XRE-family HTH domain